MSFRPSKTAAIGLTLLITGVIVGGAWFLLTRANVQHSGATFDVTSFGAKGDGSTDSAPAIQSAINAAQTNGGTVFFPAGHYLVGPASQGASLQVTGPAAITLQGASRDSVSLIETGKGDLLSIKQDGASVEDLTLDTATNNARAALVVAANHTTVTRMAVNGGDHTFALYYPGPHGAKANSPIYNNGNQVIDLQLHDALSDDGFSFSFQSDALIQNVTHTGSRLAIYVDKNVTIDGYRYTPGNQRGGKNAYWITSPSANIKILNFTSAGEGGIIGTGAGRRSSNIDIENEQLTGSNGVLKVGDVDGIQINGSNLGSSNVLAFNPQTAATAISIGTSSLGVVDFRQSQAASVPSALFNNDTFVQVTVPSGQSTATFQDKNCNPVNVIIRGGAWQNQAGGFADGSCMNFDSQNLAGH